VNKGSKRLLQYKKNVYSQAGEDGIIEKILYELPVKDNWCVEFGAWDGQHLSNTRNLIENDNYNSIQIEANNDKYKDLVNFYGQNNNVTTVNSLVGWEPKNNLDCILKDTGVPVSFDFLSIDIDGNDYHVLSAFSEFSPKVICIEFNPTFPVIARFVQKADVSINQGCSILSLVELAEKKGYKLVALLRFNAFFVKEEFFYLFDIEDNSPECLWEDMSYLTYVSVGFDGTIFVSGKKTLSWHPGVRISDGGMQVLPSFIRAFPDNYSTIQQMWFSIFVFFSNIKVKVTFGKIKGRLKALFKSN